MVAAYGKLYNGFAAFDDRGLCPQGWRVPTDTDWNMLIDYMVSRYAAFVNRVFDHFSS